MEKAQIEDQRSDLKDMEEAKKFVGFVLGESLRRFEIVDLLDIIRKIGTLSLEEAKATAIKLEEKAFSLTVASVYEDDEKRDHDIFRVYWKKMDQIISDFKNNQRVVNATFDSSSSEEWSLKSYLDRPIPSVVWRWLVAIALFSYFVLRISYLPHIVFVCYIFGTLVIVRVGAFLSPVDYSIYFNEASKSKYSNSNGASKSSNGYSNGAFKSSSDEYKPFIRRCSEFEFWEHVMLCLFISIPITFVDFFHDPMPWIPPFSIWVLSSYVLLRTPIKGMIKYKYVPFNFQKPVGICN